MRQCYFMQPFFGLTYKINEAIQNKFFQQTPSKRTYPSNSQISETENEEKTPKNDWSYIDLKSF